MQIHRIALSTAITAAVLNLAVAATEKPVGAEIDRLVQALTSEDAKVGEEARTKLDAMGAEVVPALFEKLPAADWTLKPRLLEVLSANGREFAKQKLLKGNDTEKIYAALVYDLTRADEADDHGTPEFAAMVEALLNAIDTDNEYLRAAAQQTLQGMDQCVGPGGLSAQVYQEIAEVSGGLSVQYSGPAELEAAWDQVLQAVTEHMRRDPEKAEESPTAQEPGAPSDVPVPAPVEPVVQPTAEQAEKIERLIKDLVLEDDKVTAEARQKLEGMGTEVVPILFEKLLRADWTLKPRLLEVLSANGREFAKQKLKNGSDTEKIYAALVYELSVSCAGEDFDYDSPEFKAMVEALLRAIKSDDKNLRAAAGAALVYHEDSTVFFDHLHEIVPALISSFDTYLIIDRCNRGGPVQVVLIVIGNNLTAFVGDRLINVENEVFTRPAEAKVDDPRDPQAYMCKVLSDNRAKVAELRTYWEAWWKAHSKLTAVEIARLMIERSLRIVPRDPSSRDDWNTMTADWCLQKWAGSGVAVADWAQWWDKNKATYKGPIKRRK